MAPDRSGATFYLVPLDARSIPQNGAYILASPARAPCATQGRAVAELTLCQSRATGSESVFSISVGRIGSSCPTRRGQEVPAPTNGSKRRFILGVEISRFRFPATLAPLENVVFRTSSRPRTVPFAPIFGRSAHLTSFQTVLWCR